MARADDRFSAMLAASLVAHAALVALVLLRPAASAAVPQPAPPLETADLWVGDTSLPGGGAAIPVDMAAPSPAPNAVPPSPPAVPPIAARTPTEHDAPTSQPDARTDPDPAEAPTRAAEPAPKSPRPPHKREGAPDASAAQREPRAPAEGSGDEAGAGRFGSEGQASVRDLGRAFTRAIPKACNADPAWRAVAPGDAGKLEIAIDVDGAGHVSGWAPTTKDPPPPALANLVRRTLVLLESGTFAIRAGSVSAGRQVVELRAHVSDVADDQAGSAVSLAFTYDNGRGKASFTQSGGRHVEVAVRLVRAEVH